jgi:flagellar hook-length control protein FliK
MPAQVLDQISVQINKQAKDGVDSIKVQLRPEELGRIEIKLEVSKDGSVQATVTAENKETLAMLQKDSAGLAKALSDAGLSTDSGSMNFNLRGEGQQQFAGNSNSQNGNNGSSGGSNSRAPWLSATGNDDVDVIAQSAISSDAAVDIRV